MHTGVNGITGMGFWFSAWNKGDIYFYLYLVFTDIQESFLLPLIPDQAPSMFQSASTFLLGAVIWLFLILSHHQPCSCNQSTIAWGVQHFTGVRGSKAVITDFSDLHGFSCSAEPVPGAGKEPEEGRNRLWFEPFLTCPLQDLIELQIITKPMAWEALPTASSGIRWGFPQRFRQLGNNFYAFFS